MGNEKQKTIGFYKAKHDINTAVPMIHAGEIAFVEDIFDESCTLYGEEEIFNIQDFTYLEEKEIEVEEYKRLLCDALLFQKFNYIPKGDVEFKIQDLIRYFENFTNATNIDLLVFLLRKVSSKFTAYLEGTKTDFVLKEEEAVTFAILTNVSRFTMKMNEEERTIYLKSIVEKLNIHLVNPLDVKAFSNEMIVYVANALMYDDAKEYVADQYPEVIDLYFDLMGIGVNNKIKECYQNIAYEYYLGSPFNEKDLKKAEKYLLQLAEEFDDAEALYTLGCLYYDENKDGENWKAFGFFSLASDLKMDEATYRCAEMLEGGNLSIINKSRALELYEKIYDNYFNRFLLGNYYTKFGEISYHLSKYYLDEKDTSFNFLKGYLHLLNAERAIRERENKARYLDTESIYQEIQDKIEKLGIDTVDVPNDEYEPVDLSAISLQVMMSHTVFTDYKQTDLSVKVIEKDAIKIEITPNEYPYLIFPSLEHGKAFLVDKIALKVTCQNPIEIAKSFKENSSFVFINEGDVNTLSILGANDQAKQKTFEIRDVFVLFKEMNPR